MSTGISVYSQILLFQTGWEQEINTSVIQGFEIQ